MGVKGLLPSLLSITRCVPLDRYRGLTVAVDAMSWLHKGIFACDVRTLARGQRDASEEYSSAELKCVKYTVDKAEILSQRFGMDVLFVIDGAELPAKKEENVQRRVKRNASFEKALEAEKAGDSRAARRFYAQSCSVTYKIRYELIKACRQAKISFMVAPYEADAQMARLAHTGIVDLVVTEDSDILVYGVPRALFKIDFAVCQGQEIQLMRDMGENMSLSFKNWTHDMFVFMCILSGCDYCEGIPGIGIKLAHKIVRIHRTPKKMLSALSSAGRLPHGFEEMFWLAFRTFRHQRVFCTSKQHIEPLFPIPGSSHNTSHAEMWPFLGEHIDPDVAVRIISGALHPSTKIEWDVAFKECMTDNQIHRRSSAGRSPTKPKENVWNDLVYGGRGAENTLEIHYESRYPSSNTNLDGDSMFRFFSRKSKRGRAEVSDDIAQNKRQSNESLPPLREIYVNRRDPTVSKVNKTNCVPPPGHKDLPIHLHEYSSRLVGNTFKPISRKRTKRVNDGTKSTHCVQKIWDKSTTVRGGEVSSSKKCDPDLYAERGGISIFSREKKRLVNMSCQDLTSDFGCNNSADGDCDDGLAVGGMMYPTLDDCDDIFVATHSSSCLTHQFNNRSSHDAEFSYLEHNSTIHRRPHVQNNRKSTTSGYTTVEGSNADASSRLYFPPDLSAGDYDDENCCDFDNSLQHILADEIESNSYTLTHSKTQEIRNYDEESGFFRALQNDLAGDFDKGEYRDENVEPDFEVTNILYCQNQMLGHRANIGAIFDDTLLMAFEELKQL